MLTIEIRANVRRIPGDRYAPSDRHETSTVILAVEIPLALCQPANHAYAYANSSRARNMCTSHREVPCVDV